MMPKYHIIWGAIFSLIIFFMFNFAFLPALIFFLGSFAIDIDHYFYYFMKKGKFRGGYEWFIKYEKEIVILPEKKKNKFEKPLIIFHGIEFWLTLFILGFFNNLAWWALGGVLLHAAMDFADLRNFKEPMYVKFSQIYVYIRNRGKKRVL
jgi:hypothetical protein